jgi:hypothetical protein
VLGPQALYVGHEVGTGPIIRDPITHHAEFLFALRLGLLLDLGFGKIFPTDILLSGRHTSNEIDHTEIVLWVDKFTLLILPWCGHGSI